MTALLLTEDQERRRLAIEETRKRRATQADSGAAAPGMTADGPITLDEPKIVLLDAQSKPQNITVEFESTDSPVTVLLIKDSDLDKDDEGGFAAPKKALAFKQGEKSGSFTAEVPANTATRVVVRSSNKTNVKLHITNK